MYFLTCFSDFFCEVVTLGLFGWLAGGAVCFWALLTVLQLVSLGRRPR